MKIIIKRLFDILLSVVLIIALSPILLILSLLIGIKLGRPIIFKQVRIGKDNKAFTMYKFRTMTDAKTDTGELLPDELRMTKFGGLLRSTSLDELPEIFNVLKGEMSFVGPRPLLVDYLELYSMEQIRRHEAKPGITGWAQINGRNSITWEERFSLDVWYVDNWNTILDLKILIMTFVKVFKREGVSQQNHVTMERFKGYKDKAEI